MRELAQTRVRYGYRRLQVLLTREAWALGKSLAYRIYTEEALQLRSKRPRRRKMWVTRRARYVPDRPNQAWSMDFVSDQLTDGTRFRALTIIHVFTREALTIRVGQRLAPSRWSKSATGWSRGVVLPLGSSSTTAASSPGVCSISGPTTTTCRSTSAVPASRPTLAPHHDEMVRC
jgi:hypothetical protein